MTAPHSPHVERGQQVFVCPCGCTVTSAWRIGGMALCWDCALVLIARINEAAREASYERYHNEGSGGY